MPLTNAMIPRRTQLAEPNQRAARSLRSDRSYSEEMITPEISLTVSAVLAAFTILTEDLASLPLILYDRRGRNRFRAYQSPYYRLLHDQPNPEHTSMVFRELMIGHLLGWGNFYGQTIVDRRGDVAEIWPLRPDRMLVARVDGQKIYAYRTSAGEPRLFLPDEILHVPAFGFDGLTGFSRIGMARNAIGLSISTEKFGSKFFSNGANPGIIYMHPGDLSDQAFRHLQESLEEKKGVDQAHNPIILEEGMSIDKLGINPDDAQFLETRKFQVSEIARIFRVPPHMIGDVDRSTSWGSGIDAQEQGYVNHTLRPWATRIEQFLNLQILPTADRETMFYEHLMDGLLRGDIATRYQAYVSAINNGILSRNEVRARENMNPYKGGDTMLVPLNMRELGADQGGTAANVMSGRAALEPLWRDAIGRAIKRETQDVAGAARRFLARGQREAWSAWLDQFFGVDQPAFVRRQLQPIIEAAARLFDVDQGDQVDAYITEFLSDRRATVGSLEFETLTGDQSVYASMATEEILHEVLSITEDTYA